MPVSEATYLQLALEDPESKWELHCGQLRSKQPMAWEHNTLFSELGYLLRAQLNPHEYRVYWNAGHMRRSASNYYIPDVIVFPTELARRLSPEPGMLAVFPEPLPLVVEVWSPSTGRVDMFEKLPEYQQRGDQEIWLIHPYERWLFVSVRQSDGSYQEARHHGGVIVPAYLPNVRINLDDLFAFVDR